MFFTENEIHIPLNKLDPIKLIEKAEIHCGKCDK